MFRVLMLMILLAFILPPPAYSQNFKVKEVQEDLEQVILVDKDTENEWVAQVGDEIEGWRIMEISPDYITIVKPREGMSWLTTKIPVKERAERTRGRDSLE